MLSNHLSVFGVFSKSRSLPNPNFLLSCPKVSESDIEDVCEEMCDCVVDQYIQEGRKEGRKARGFVCRP